MPRLILLILFVSLTFPTYGKNIVPDPLGNALAAGGNEDWHTAKVGVLEFIHTYGSGVLADIATAALQEQPSPTTRSVFQCLYLIHTRKIAEARELFSQQSLSLQKEVSCRLLAGELAYQGKVPNEAYQPCQDALDTPWEKTALVIYGRCLLFAGQIEDALVSAKAAIEKDHKHYDAYLLLGQIYAQMGELPQSLYSYTEAIRINSDLVEAYNQRGLIYIDLGKQDKASQDFDRARKLTGCDGC